VIASDAGVVYIPGRPTAWPLVALRNTRIGRRRLTAIVETTQPGVVTLELRRSGRVIRLVRKRVDRGHATLRVAARPTGRFYALRATLQSNHGAAARDQVEVLSARELSVARAKKLLQVPESDDPVEFFYRSDRCRPFGTRRVDCEIRDLHDDGSGAVTDRCDSIGSATLRRSGIVLKREYACGDRRHGRFQPHPRWDSNIATPGGSDF
jgi:hypothetical protein